MKTIKQTLSKDLKHIEIEIFSDLHVGSKKCDFTEINRRVERVKNNDNVYAVCLGDFMDNATRASVGDVYEEALSPMQQMQLCISTFEPIKHKILCITSGNHERRTYKQDGIDLMWMFANELGLANCYDYAACLLFLRFGIARIRSDKSNNRQMCYTMYLTHGDGNSGRTVGGKANGLQRRGAIVNSDIVITGHTHLPLTFRDSFFEINYGTSAVVKKEQVFVNASSCLDYEEYAELYGMRPASKRSPVISLSGVRKEIIVTV